MFRDLKVGGGTAAAEALDTLAVDAMDVEHLAVEHTELGFLAVEHTEQALRALA